MQRQNSQITMDVDEPSDENLKKIADNAASELPAETLLGSITTNASAGEEKSMLIRTSARVFKKMKLEQEQDKKNEDPNHPEASLTSPNSDNPMVTTGVNEKSTEHEGKGHPIRSSTRVVKKPKQDVTSTTETKNKKDEPKPDTTKKEARKWNYGDKMIFFEAVNEFGKDYENIQQYINAKLKKKGASEEQMKSKEHVRQFFLRTFHEVSKYVKFSDGVKKVVQELYGVINYGELYRKLGVITEKVFMKLNELIYSGETCVRVKGKNNRIKTPMCRALIKLNQLDEKYEEIKLPNRVTVELRPKDMTSYIKVQCLAQNPRLKTTLPIQKRLSSLIQCLCKRWKTVDAVMYEKSIVSNNPITNECVPSKEETDNRIQLLTPLLKLSPPPEARIELPSINISEYLTRQTICLTAYENRLGLDTYTEIKKTSTKKKPKLQLLDVEPRVAEEVCEIKIEPVKQEEPEPSKYYENEPDAMLANAVHEAVNTILSLQTADRQQPETSEPEEQVIKTEIIQQESPPKTNVPEISREDLEQLENIRRGWTEATSESLTIGEIYLMYGYDAKLILEYSWMCDIKEVPEKPKRPAANFLEVWNESYEESWEMKQRTLSSSLSKLLSLAKLHYRQDAVKCPCGHVCNDKSLKSSTIIGSSKGKRGIIVDSNVGQVTIKQEYISTEATNGQETCSLFRTPAHILPNGPAIDTPTMEQQLNSIQRLKPKFSNRKGRRLRQKPIVVERKLPLLPNNLSGHQIVRMSIISQEPPAVPAESNLDAMEESTGLQKMMRDPEDDNSSVSTIPSSPSRILKESESEWINAEVADYSLSSLLGHLESPIKTPVPIGTLNPNMASDLSSEVDAQLQSLMTENSMDFAASFADLAASVVSDRKY